MGGILGGLFALCEQSGLVVLRLLFGTKLASNGSRREARVFVGASLLFSILGATGGPLIGLEPRLFVAACGALVGFTLGVGTACGLLAYDEILRGDQAQRETANARAAQLADRAKIEQSVAISIVKALGPNWDLARACDVASLVARHGYSMEDALIKTRSNCLVTTACAFAAGLPDDCRELTMLRRLRENYVVHLTDKDEWLEEYRYIGPLIIDAIQASPKAESEWREVLSDIRQAADLVEDSRYEEAFVVYVSMTRKLQRQFLRAGN